MELQSSFIAHSPFSEPPSSEEEGITASHENLSPAPFNLKATLFFSFLLHFIIVAGLVIGAYRQDKRPVKEVAYWVVNLVTLVNAETRGSEKGSSKTTMPEGLRKAANLKLEKEPIAKETTPRPKPEEGSTVAKEVAGEPTDIPQAPPPLPVSHPGENSLKLMQDAVSSQVQAGQYRFVMKMPDQMMAFKFKHFQKSVRDQAAALLKTSLSDETMGRLLKQRAAVEIYYLEDGSLQNVSFTQDSDQDLVSFMQEKISWHSLSPPAGFALPNKAMRLRIGINDQGQINVGVELL